MHNPMGSFRLAIGAELNDHVESVVNLGMYRLEDPNFHRVVVGRFTICKQSEGKVWISDNDEDAGEFDETKLEEVIKSFYDRNL